MSVEHPLALEALRQAFAINKEDQMEPMQASADPRAKMDRVASDAEEAAQREHAYTETFFSERRAELDHVRREIDAHESALLALHMRREGLERAMTVADEAGPAPISGPVTGRGGY